MPIVMSLRIFAIYYNIIQNFTIKDMFIGFYIFTDNDFTWQIKLISSQFTVHSSQFTVKAIKSFAAVNCEP